MNSDYFQFSPKLLSAAMSGALDLQKQTATYVGLPRRGKQVDVNARISLPTAYKQASAKRMISLVAREFRDIYRLIVKHDSYFGIEELDEIIQSHEVKPVYKWPHNTGLKSNRYREAHGLRSLKSE